MGGVTFAKRFATVRGSKAYNNVHSLFLNSEDEESNSSEEQDVVIGESLTILT